MRSPRWARETTVAAATGDSDRSAIATAMGVMKRRARGVPGGAPAAVPERAKRLRCHRQHPGAGRWRAGENWLSSTNRVDAAAQKRMVELQRKLSEEKKGLETPKTS